MRRSKGFRNTHRYLAEMKKNGEGAIMREMSFWRRGFEWRGQGVMDEKARDHRKGRIGQRSTCIMAVERRKEGVCFNCLTLAKEWMRDNGTGYDRDEEISHDAQA